MQKQIEYKHLEFAAPCKSLPGRPNSKTVDAVNGVTITRVVDANDDYFLVKGPNMEDYEVPASAVVRRVKVKGAPTITAKGGKASSPDE